MFIFLVSECDRGILTFGKKICMVLKTAFCVSTRFFWGKNASIKTLITDFLHLRGKTFQSSAKLFVAFCQNAIIVSSKALGGIDDVWDKFWQFWQKFWAWVTIKLSTCQREPFDEENVSIIFHSLTFFRAGNFSVFWRFLYRQGCQTCNLRDRRRFLMNRSLWEN